MGGAFFQAAGLHVPRMPHDVYGKVSTELVHKLDTLFAYTAIPLEAPEKADHGDIDVIVALHESKPPPNVEAIAQLIGAVHFTQVEPNGSAHFVLAWPEDQSDNAPLVADTADRDKVTQSAPTSVEQPPRYIQADIKICKTVTACRFLLFKHGHGDFWNMVGSMIRPHGLTVNDYGLYLRIEGSDTWAKTIARVLITDQPNQVLTFLGFDAEKFWRPFASYDEIMDYVATCLFYDPTRGQRRETDRQTNFLNRADVQRVRRRRMYGYWVEQYLPTHQDAPMGKWANISRSDVVEAAKLDFGREFSERYETQRVEGTKRMMEAELWADIRREIPVTGAGLGKAMKRLKVEITELLPRSEAAIEPPLTGVQQAYIDGDYERVKQWAIDNWEAVRSSQETMTT